MNETQGVPSQGQVVALSADPCPIWRVRSLSPYPALGVTVATVEHVDDSTQTRQVVYRARQRL